MVFGYSSPKWLVHIFSSIVFLALLGTLQPILLHLHTSVCCWEKKNHTTRLTDFTLIYDCKPYIGLNAVFPHKTVSVSSVQTFHIGNYSHSILELDSSLSTSQWDHSYSMTVPFSRELTFDFSASSTCLWLMTFDSNLILFSTDFLGSILCLTVNLILDPGFALFPLF